MKRVCVLGSNGFIGKNLIEQNPGWVGVSREILDLTNQLDVEKYFKHNQYDIVIHSAVVGGSRLKEDQTDVFYQNVIMFENVVRVFKGRIIYFSSGAALGGNPPVDPYGFSKWLIDKRINTLPNVYSLRIWGCYGPHEPCTRFSYICKNNGHVVIDHDRYFDFVSIWYVNKIVHEFVNGKKSLVKFCDLVYPKKMLLSEWADFFGATYEIKNYELGKSYIKDRT
jgi:nucleoside-diphosphate-sugar epimerase